MNYSSYPILTVAFGTPIHHDVKLHGKGWLCMRCKKVNRTPWKHPMLVALKKRNLWRGSVFGGVIVCEACGPLVNIELAAIGASSPLDESEIPSEFREATWADFSDRRGALKAAKKEMQAWYDSNDPSWLYIFGRVGTGKTRAACTLLRQWLIDRGRVRFIRAHDFFVELREAEFRHESGGLSVKSLSRYQALAFDDMGAEKPTDYTRSRLLALIEARHDHQARTIVTSNYTLSELAERLGDDRVPSRLAMWCQLVTLKATDYRLEEAKRRKGKMG